LFYNVAKGLIDVKDLKEYVASEKVVEQKPQQTTDNENIQSLIKQVKTKDSDILLIGEDLQKIDYKLSSCCNPIPGDDVFGFVTVSEGIKIHRTNCPNATKLMSSFGYRIIKAKWTSQKQLAFLTGLQITGIDEVGLINNLTQIISNDFKVNMRSITVDSDEGIFSGSIMVYVNDTQHLEDLITKLKQVKGIIDIVRFDSDNEKVGFKSAG
jgi:GTP pyrophosphokinase